MSRAIASTLRAKLRLMLGAASLLLILPVVAASVHLARMMSLSRQLAQVEVAETPASAPARLPSRAGELRRKIDAAGDRALRDIISLGALSLVALVTMTIVAPVRLLRPLTRLANLIRQAEGGNLRVVLDRVDPDEIGELTSRLHRMLQELQRFDGLKRAKVQALAAQRDQLLELLGTPAVVVDAEGRLLQASTSFRRGFGLEESVTVEQRLLDVLGWQDTPVAALLSTEEPGTELEAELSGRRYRVRLRRGRDGDDHRLLLFTPV